MPLSCGARRRCRTRPLDGRELPIGRLQAKVGSLTIGNELLEAKIGAPGGRPPFGASEVEAMSPAVSPTSSRRYGLLRVTHMSRTSRHGLSRPQRGAVYFRGRPGPVVAMADVTLLLSPTRAQLRTRTWADSC
jgi:hypothetical protein